MSGWYASWFDSPYYHMLYKHRDHEEARLFLTHLLKNIPTQKGMKMMDKACGRGRHAGFLGSLGFDVTGTDLSSNNIRHARRYFGKQAHFDIQDMQHRYQESYFDVIFSLFTSFGYFETDEENLHVLRVTYDELNPGGYFVFDYLNIGWVLEHLKDHEKKTIHQTAFQIQRSVVNDSIVKDILVKDGDHTFQFQEIVKAYAKSDLEKMLYHCGFQITNVYGDYTLGQYDPQKSPRTIFIAQKPWK